MSSKMMENLQWKSEVEQVKQKIFFYKEEITDDKKYEHEYGRI